MQASSRISSKFVSILSAIIILVFAAVVFGACYHYNINSARISVQELSELTDFPENGPVIITGGKLTSSDGKESYILQFELNFASCLYMPRMFSVAINGHPASSESAYRGDLYLLVPNSENRGRFTIEISSEHEHLPELAKYVYFGSTTQISDFVNTSIMCNYYLQGGCFAIMLACVILYVIKRNERYLIWLAALSFFSASYYRVKELMDIVFSCLEFGFLDDYNSYQVINQIVIACLQYKVMSSLMPVKLGKKSFLWYVIPAAMPALLLFFNQTAFTAALCFFYFVLYLCYLLCFLKIPAAQKTDKCILFSALIPTVILRFFDILCEGGLLPSGDINLRFRLRGIISIIFIMGFFIIVMKRFAQKFNEADLLNIHLEEESRRKAREQTIFVRSMLHNLKTPVFSLSGYTDMAIKALETSPETALRYMKKTNEKALLVGQMMDNIFLVTQIQSDMMILQEVPVDLRSVLTAVMDSSTEAARGKKHIETLDIAESLSVTGDPLYLQQAFQNIVDNARIHTPEGGSICVSVGKVSELAEIKISDTGCGIAPEEAGKIFDAYYSKHADGKRSSGLGLYISSEIIKRHHGTVTVSSEPGRGACFTVQLPLSSEKI